jgi:nucleoside-diphosphate kinase
MTVTVNFVNELKIQRLMIAVTRMVVIFLLNLTKASGNLFFSKSKSPGLPRATLERTLVIVKPDAVDRGLIGEVIQRFEKKCLRLVAIKLLVPTRSKAIQHYHDLKDQPFFQNILNFFTSGSVVVMIWEGQDAIVLARKIVGSTHPADAEPGTIRGDYCGLKGRNLVHASDSVHAAEKEIRIWFNQLEISSSFF